MNDEEKSKCDFLALSIADMVFNVLLRELKCPFFIYKPQHSNLHVTHSLHGIFFSQKPQNLVTAQ